MDGMLLDPRIAAIKRNLERFNAFIAVMSSKGGVGKTFLVAILASILANRYNVNVSLLDMDLTNPTLHIVMGLDARNVKIEEDKGIKPFKINANIELMTMAYFVQDYSTPLRGKEIENAIKEILAITKWNGDTLVIDMPPGFSDSHLEFLRLFNLSKALVVLITTPQLLALSSIEKFAKTLLLDKVPITGIIGNMCRSEFEDKKISNAAEMLNLNYFGCIPYIDNVENFYGTRLSEIAFHIEPRIEKAVKSLLSVVRSGKKAQY